MEFALTSFILLIFLSAEWFSKSATKVGLSLLLAFVAASLGMEISAALNPQEESFGCIQGIMIYYFSFAHGQN